jgi:hypothetical protein
MVAGPLFGLKETSSHATSVSDDETTGEDWSGRLNYIEKKMEGIVGNASHEILDKIEALEEVCTADGLKIFAIIKSLLFYRSLTVSVSFSALARAPRPRNTSTLVGCRGAKTS